MRFQMNSLARTEFEVFFLAEFGNHLSDWFLIVLIKLDTNYIRAGESQITALLNICSGHLNDRMGLKSKQHSYNGS